MLQVESVASDSAVLPTVTLASKLTMFIFPRYIRGLVVGLCVERSGSVFTRACIERYANTDRTIAWQCDLSRSRLAYWRGQGRQAHENVFYIDLYKNIHRLFIHRTMYYDGR